MNRNLYLLGILFLGLTFATGLFQSIAYFQLGPQIFTLESFTDWFLVGSIIALVSSFFLLKYYHYKGYRFTFSAATISIIATFFQLTILYTILMSRRLESYYIPVLMLVAVTGITYAVSLIFSDAGKRLWLKIAGVVLLILGLVLVSVITWTAFSPQLQTSGTMELINKWVTLVTNLVPVLFIMNFLSELAKAKKDTTASMAQRSFEGVMTIISIIALGSALFIGQKMAVEKYWLLDWINRGPERGLALAQPFESRIYINSQGDTLRYRLMKPLEYDSTEKYPLVVCLHGGGGWGTDNVKQIEGSWSAQMLMKYEHRQTYPAFLFVPQCPPRFSWGGIPNLPTVDSLVFETIAALENEFEIDEQRRYVMGESLGGYGSWHFICSRPSMFAAAVPICGGGDPALAKNIVDVAVWALHGEKDRSVPVRFSRDMIEEMKNAGGDPRYTEFPGAGHIISDQVYSTPGLLEWLFAQKRD